MGYGRARIVPQSLVQFQCIVCEADTGVKTLRNFVKGICVVQYDFSHALLTMMWFSVHVKMSFYETISMWSIHLKKISKAFGTAIFGWTSRPIKSQCRYVAPPTQSSRPIKSGVSQQGSLTFNHILTSCWRHDNPFLIGQWLLVEFCCIIVL